MPETQIIDLPGRLKEESQAMKRNRACAISHQIQWPVVANVNVVSREEVCAEISDNNGRNHGSEFRASHCTAILLCPHFCRFGPNLALTSFGIP
jgi:hypothetical protein